MELSAKIDALYKLATRHARFVKTFPNKEPSNQYRTSGGTSWELEFHIGEASGKHWLLSNGVHHWTVSAAGSLIKEQSNPGPIPFEVAQWVNEEIMRYNDMVGSRGRGYGREQQKA